MRNDTSKAVDGGKAWGHGRTGLSPDEMQSISSARGDAAAAARQLSAALKAERDRFLALAFCWADLLFELDRERRIVYATGAINTLLGREPRTLLGESLDHLVADSDRDVLGDLLTIACKRGRVDSTTLRFEGMRGDHLRFSVSGYQLDDLNGHFFVAMRFLDHTPTGRQPHHGHDEATGLRTALSFVDAVTRHLVAGAGWSQGNFMVVSIDDFATLRRRLPRLAESELLQSIGSCLRASAIDGDSAGRLGENRFGVILDQADDGQALLERIRSVSQRLDPSHEGLEVQASTVPIDSRDIPREHLARFVAVTIRQFCNQDCAVGTPVDLTQDIAQAVQQTMRTVGRMRQIITNADFQVAFQPIVDVRTGQIHHFEALARFPAATGMKTAFENITFAESTGLITEFDLAMVRRIVSWYASCDEEGARTQIAVNLSGQSVNSAAFFEALDLLLQANPSLSGQLMFEITESCALADLDAANAFLQHLRAQGFRTCLDDLGAGAANISYLSMLQVDVVKLDGQALHDARKSRIGRGFLGALVRLCRDLGVSTVAEMVEDSEMLAFVRDCGVDYVQGYLFGRPSPDIQVFQGAIPRGLFCQDGGNKRG